MCDQTIRNVLRLGSVAVLLTVGVFLLASIAHEQYESWQEHKAFPRVGQSFDIGGRTLNLYCSGTGTPTVILDSGHSVAGLGWAGIQPQVSRFTRACWYDRAGYGWSEPGPFPRRSNEIAEDLHRLLIAADVRPPYVLVGHLFGAFNVRAYQQFYPSEVTGMMLIDPSSEDSSRDNPTIPPNRHIEALRPLVIRIAATIAELGVTRWRRGVPGPMPAGFTAQDWGAISMLNRQPKTIAARIQETPLRFSAAQMHRPLSPGDLPLIVLSPNLEAEDCKTSTEKIHLQAALANLSSDGQQIILPPATKRIPYENSTHMGTYESPVETAAAIQKLVIEAKAYRNLQSERYEG